LPQVFDEVNKLCSTPYDCYVSSSFVDKPYAAGAVHFAPYFDAVDIVPHANFVFCHGGINMVMLALQQAVPLLMVPGAIHERRHNAHEVTAVDAGILVEIDDFTVSNLSSILLDQAQERELQRNAKRVQQQIIASGGMRRAFAEMESSWLAPYDKGRLELVARHMRTL
jgi:UDP:flavonoid glycosyltransferase YjiC (YdhE family)